MDKPKLERCPFCGASAEFYEFKRARTEMIGIMTDASISHPLPSQYLARCTNKECNGNTPGTKFFWTEEDVAEAWNRRAPLPDNKALTCEGCIHQKRTGWHYEPCVRCKRHWNDLYRRPPEKE